MKKGTKVKMAPNCLRDIDDINKSDLEIQNRLGIVLGPDVFVEQFWTPILWSDKQDPTFCKASTLLKAKNQENKPEPMK